MTLPPTLLREWKRFLKAHRLHRWLGRGAMYGMAAAILIVAWFAQGLPDISGLNQFTRAPSVLIKSEDGKIIGSFGDIYGDYVAFNDLPKSLVDAVLATEDRNFYHHFGIDVFGLLRATVANIRAGRVVQGGSTITQQVAKNVFLTPERSFSRKLKEMLLAISIERRFSKEEILSIYLNRVYLGAGNYGVDSAAKRYFRKSARQLTLSESAVLAGMLKAPSRFAPTSNPALAKKRAELVLKGMEDAGYLNAKEEEKARRDLDATLGERQRESQSSFYFADWIMEQLPEYVGNIEEDIVVVTTFRPEFQALGEKAIAAVMDEQSAAYKTKQAALLALSPDGAVRAMIGGRSYAKSQYNRVTQALRQPGSAFKLFVYLAALESGMTPGTLVEDAPISVPIVGGTWEPQNYTHEYLGAITLKEAVTRSVNTVAVQVSQAAGLGHVIDVARRLGVTSDILEVPAIALGATEVTLLELTAAYAHLANRGVIVIPYGIERIETAGGEILYARHSNISGIVLKPEIIGEMNDMLLNVVAEGTGRAANIGRPAAGKTGTTSDYRDAWFMGYTPDLVTGVWVGNDDNSAMKKVTGGMLPARIWHDFMQGALGDTPVSEIPTSDLPPALPWQQDMTQDAAPAEAAADGLAPLLPWQAAPEPEAPGIEEKDLPKEGGVKLGPSFWNKLME